MEKESECDGERIPVLRRDQYEVLEYERVAGHTITSNLIYAKSEKMLYSKNGKCKQGEAWRCRDRKLDCCKYYVC